MNNLLCLNDRNFKETILNIGIPLLVDFWASWCPPCKMVEPMLRELAEEQEEKIKIAKINVDQNRRTASFYGISGVPTFILFDSGKIICQRIGAQSKHQLKEMLKKVKS